MGIDPVVTCYLPLALFLASMLIRAIVDYLSRSSDDAARIDALEREVETIRALLDKKVKRP